MKLVNGKNEVVKVIDIVKELTEGTGLVHTVNYSISREEDGSFSVGDDNEFESWEFDAADLQKAIDKFNTVRSL